MDKVIIDGVDVSECEYANACDKKLKCVILQDDVCETKPYCEGYNCHYKQLMRARAEIEIYKQSEIEGQEIVAELKAENEKLKSDFDKCMDANKYHFDKWCKCEQCLQEIKEIAERQLLITNVRTYQMVYYADFYQYRNEILAKINEVIGAEG